MVPRRRQAGRRRSQASRRSSPPPIPSVTEIAVYGMLAAGVAAGLLILDGRPRSLAIGVVVSALVLIGVLGFASTRIRRSPPHEREAPRQDSPETPPQEGSTPPERAGPGAPRQAGSRRRRRH